MGKSILYIYDSQNKNKWIETNKKEMKRKHSHNRGCNKIKHMWNVEWEMLVEGKGCRNKKKIANREWESERERVWERMKVRERAAEEER